MKWTLVSFDLQGNGTGNGLPNIKDAFAESFELQLSVLYQSICIFKAGLSSLSDDWAKYKEKVPDVSDSNHMLKQDAIPISSLTELKDLVIKRVQKISQRWIMCIANIAILELRIFSGRYHFRFTSTGEKFYCWRWLVLPKVSQGKWFQDLQRPCM